MKKIIIAILLFGSMQAMKAQFTVDFESFKLDSGKVLNGANGDTLYRIKLDTANIDLLMPVFWDTGWGGYWASGWALSSKFDSATVPSDLNRHLYCAKPGKGFDGSRTYAVGQNHSYFLNRGPLSIFQFKIANTTYAYNSMKYGDFVAKKFGGANGKDKDYFFCRISVFRKGVFQELYDVYLADFRSDDSSKHFIAKDWINVPINGATLPDSVTFELFSSDTGIYGINTPTFFAIDNILMDWFESTSLVQKIPVKMWPVPARQNIQLESNSEIKQVSIFDNSGKQILKKQGTGNHLVLDVSKLGPGMYPIVVQTINGNRSGQIMIQR